LQPGDAVLLKRGFVWRETLEVSGSGRSDAPLRIGAYGSDSARPVIDGSGARKYNIKIQNGVFIKISDLELRGSTLMPVNILNEGVSLENTLASDTAATLPRLLNVVGSQRWHGAWFLGLYSDPTGATSRFSKMIGSVPAVVHVFVPWASPWGTETFNPWLMDGIASTGAAPMVSWEPMNWGNSDAADPAFSLDRILAGTWDNHIRAWATAAATWNKPLLLRFAHEMNGDWTPWAVGDGRNGNTAAKYVAAWIRIHNMFRDAGATKVQFVWSPDGGPNLQLLPSLYPGDSYVDYVAIDQYNWGSTAWASAYELLLPSYSVITSITNKPLFIAETGVPEEGGSKAEYILKLFGYTIPALLPRIQGVCWFNESKQRDWRVETSSSSLASYNEAVRSYAWSRTLATVPVPLPKKRK
jgi:beta-mannanase